MLGIGHAQEAIPGFGENVVAEPEILFDRRGPGLSEHIIRCTPCCRVQSVSRKEVFRSEWCGQFSGEREHAEKDPRLGMKLRMKFDASLTACELSL